VDRFQNAGTYLLTDSMGSRRFIHLKEVDKQGYGIIFNHPDGKVMISGKGFSAGELPSQAACCELFLYLLKSPDRHINNRELPPSSYSKNKSQMLGKVIRPFVKKVEEELQTGLPIEVTGGLHDYQVMFGHTDIAVALLS
jgi:hypothetical protein